MVSEDLHMLRCTFLCLAMACATSVDEPPPPILSQAPFVAVKVYKQDDAQQVEVELGTRSSVGPLQMGVFVNGSPICQRDMVDEQDSCTFTVPRDGLAATIDGTIRTPDGVVGEGNWVGFIEPPRSPDIVFDDLEWIAVEGDQHLPISIDGGGDTATLVLHSSIDGLLLTEEVDVPFAELVPVVLSPGRHELTALATNDLQMTDAATWQGWVTTPPEIPELLPLPNVITSETSLKALLARLPTHADGDPVSVDWSWSRTGSRVFSSLLPSLRTQRGQEWTLEVVAHTRTGARSSPSSHTLQITNSPPRVESVHIDSAYRCEATLTDADGDTLDTTFVWTDDAGEVVGQGAIRPALEEPLTCTVSTDDGHGGTDAAWVRSPSAQETTLYTVTITNGAPYLPSIAPSAESVELTWQVDGEDVHTGGLLVGDGIPEHARVRVVAEIRDGDLETRVISEAFSVPSQPLANFDVQLVTSDDPTGTHRCHITEAPADANHNVTLYRAYWETRFGDIVTPGWRSWPGDLYTLEVFSRSVRCFGEATDGFATRTVGSLTQRYDDCDEDGDGHVADHCGGDDCDDSNHNIHRGALELVPTIDSNCDGLLCPSVIPAHEAPYYTFCSNSVTLAEARETCAAAGHDGLAEFPASQSVTEILRGAGLLTVVLPTRFWLGMVEDDGWHWDSGAPVAYDRWIDPDAPGDAVVYDQTLWERTSAEATNPFVCMDR